ncbi:MAG: hypothetical protein ABJE66_30065 [Deltaproteobacteria bacterium]
MSACFEVDDGELARKSDAGQSGRNLLDTICEVGGGKLVRGSCPTGKVVGTCLKTKGLTRSFYRTDAPDHNTFAGHYYSVGEHPSDDSDKQHCTDDGGVWQKGFVALQAAPTLPAAPPQTSGATRAPAHLPLGDATVYELVDRRWRKVDPPHRELVLHADGTAEMINDKTGKAWLTFHVTEDGAVSLDGKRVAMLTDQRILNADGTPSNIEVHDNTVSFMIGKEPVHVVLAQDGRITVLDRPDGVKWRIDASSPAVMRTAFLLLAATTMKIALD